MMCCFCLASFVRAGVRVMVLFNPIQVFNLKEGTGRAMGHTLYKQTQLCVWQSLSLLLKTCRR